VVMAFFVGRWNRGVLPVAAALAILFAVVAAVAGPAWFERDKDGFEESALEPSILGLLTLILVPVQLLLIVFAMRGFQQEWNVEVEVTRDEAERHRGGGHDAGQIQPA
jgi:protein-S-isoprenylcysteine O-methyltransferase Ste14